MKSYFIGGRRARRNPDDSARSVVADAACNARQPASIIMTIEHNKSRGFARGVPGETEKRKDRGKETPRGETERRKVQYAGLDPR